LRRRDPVICSPKNRLRAGTLALALALGACSGDSGLLSKESKFDFTLPMAKAKEEPKQRAVSAEQLIGANGRCAGEEAPQALNFTAGPQAGPTTPSAPPPGTTSGGAPPVRTGVSLGMSECEVVRALGHTDRIEISTNERGQRSVTLTYLSGERPGVYRFVAGQLVSLERAGEAPAAKPAKPKKAAK
jgi:hypothetical protein